MPKLVLFCQEEIKLFGNNCTTREVGTSIDQLPKVKMTISPDNTGEISLETFKVESQSRKMTRRRNGNTEPNQERISQRIAGHL